ncbi:MAG: thioredoxin family protein [Bdellovibrionota bacterium]
MARVESKMVDLGSEAPDFFLPEVRNNEKIGLYDVLGGHGLLVMFISRHCPFVQHIKKQITNLASEYLEKGVRFVAISSNDVANYPDDHPKKLAEMAEEEGWKFPFLFDESQDVARSYEAMCTPDFFSTIKKARLVYRGQLDGSRPGNDVPCDGRDLRVAMEALIKGHKINLDQKPSIGCNIKWKD